MVWAILNEEQDRALNEIVKTNSDRIIAVVGGAMLDQSLRVTLEERLRGDRDTSNKLFKVNGPLGNLGPKIDLAYQLYVFGKQTRDALLGLSEIRNTFAHNMSASFASPDDKLTASLSRLTLHEGRTHYPNPISLEESQYEIAPATDNQRKFVVNLQLALIALMADRTSHKMWSNTTIEGRTSPFA